MIAVIEKHLFAFVVEAGHAHVRNKFTILISGLI